MTLLCFDNYLAALAHKSECDNLGVRCSRPFIDDRHGWVVRVGR